MQKKKVLFVANIAKHILRFHLPYLKWFQENGYETHVAANGSDVIPFCDVQHNVPIARSPFSVRNIRAHKILKDIIDTNNFSLVHGHTPMGGILARSASVESRKKGTKVLYTAHGFHFYKGAPLKNWLLYYPMEKFFSSFTDGIVTINKEDYLLLFDRKFNTPNKFHIFGIGIDDSRFEKVRLVDKQMLREKNGYNLDQFILLYVAELIPRKNHKFIIDTAKYLSNEIPNLKILFAGRGVLLEELKKYAVEKSVDHLIDFLGFRDDVGEVMAMANIGVSSSKHEGLGLNLAEEMFLGLPIIASDDRGHRELVQPGVNGYLFAQNSHEEFVEYVINIYENEEIRNSFAKESFRLAQKFKLENSIESMSKIYNHILQL